MLFDESSHYTQNLQWPPGSIKGLQETWFQYQYYQTNKSSMTYRENQNVQCIPGIINMVYTLQDDVIKWKHFPRYWPFVWGIHWWPVNSPHKGQWHGALMLSLILDWINGWVDNREAGDLRCHHAHFDIIVMVCFIVAWCWLILLTSTVQHILLPDDLGQVKLPVRQLDLSNIFF